MQGDTLLFMHFGLLARPTDFNRFQTVGTPIPSCPLPVTLRVEAGHDDIGSPSCRWVLMLVPLQQSPR